MKTSVLASLAMALSTAMAAPFPIDNARVDHSEGSVTKREGGFPSLFDLPQAINPGQTSGLGSVPELGERPTQWRDDVPNRADPTHALDAVHAPAAEGDGKGSARGSAKNLLNLGEDGPLGNDAHTGAGRASEGVANKDDEGPLGNSHLLQGESLRHADPEHANDRGADPASEGVTDKESEGPLGNSHLLQGGSLRHADLEHATKDE